MKLEIDIDEDYYKIICKRVQDNKPFHSPYEYEVIADGKPIEQEPIIDRIRAEIIEKDRNVKAVRNDGCCFFTADEVLEIIDKYIAESEEK